MIRRTLQIGVATGLVLVGWMTAKAQTSAPDFEIVVNAPSGQTTIECVRGCELSWVERGLNPDSATMRTFTFRCDGNLGGRCSSHRIGGWTKR